VDLRDIAIVGDRVIAVGDNGVILASGIPPQVTAYTTWTTSEGLDSSTRNAALDPNGDGVPNGIAYLFGLPALGPVSPAWTELRPRVVSLPDSLALSFTLPFELPEDVILSIDRSTSLAPNEWSLLTWRTRSQSWPSAFVSELVHPDGSIEVTLDLGGELETTEFFRLRVTFQ
jgi:hypothetical protein